MRIFKTSSFVRFARSEDIRDDALCEAVARAERGLVDANLGAGVIKQRVARPNQGRSGGFRCIIFFRAAERAFFFYGFAKNEKDNISAGDLMIFKRAASAALALSAAEISKLIEAKQLMEVICVEEKIQQQNSADGA